MNYFFGAIVGMWEAVLILVVVMVLFGAKKMPGLFKSLGSSIREFKAASRDTETASKGELPRSAGAPGRAAK